MNDVPEPVIYSRDEHSISRSQIDPDALKIMRRLIRFGHKGYLVGGGVRDLLLEKSPKDFDIATDATPRKMKALFRNCRIIGKRFKLAHIYFRGGKIIEVATFRQQTNDEDEDEPVTLGKDNTFGNEQSDAIRRDLTINGLFYDLANFSVIDYVGGVEDLRNKVVRIIGDPETRFVEDPVRMLRVARHAGRTDFDIHDQTFAAVQPCLPLLDNVAPVRIYEEIKKDMTSGHFSSIVTLLDSLGLLGLLLPNWSQLDEAPWKQDSKYFRIFTELDLVYRDDGLQNVTLALTALAVLYGIISSEQEFFTDCVSSRDDVPEFVGKVFDGLLVPKREKEKIYDILNCLQTFEKKGVKAIHPQHIKTKNNLNTLIRLLNLFEHPQMDPDTEEILSNITLRKKKNSRGSRGKKRYMRKPGGKFR